VDSERIALHSRIRILIDEIQRIGVAAGIANRDVELNGAEALLLGADICRDLEKDSDPSPLTTESLIQEFGFREGSMPNEYELAMGENVSLIAYRPTTDQRSWLVSAYGIGHERLIPIRLQPLTKGQLRRLLSLLADIQASLEGEEGKG
jgi:hypothetical protein